SMALEQKLPCGGTVLPFHSKTRARTDLIFMIRISRVGGVGAKQRLTRPVGSAHSAGNLERIGGGIDVGLAQASDVIGCSVCGCGDRNWQAPLHRYALGEAHKLDGDLALVVVEGDDGIQLTVPRL